MKRIVLLSIFLSCVLAGVCQTKTAYLNDSGCDLDNLMSQLRVILENNHFELMSNPDEADIFIDVKNSVDYEGVVQGEISDLNESYVNLQMKFYNNKNQQLLLSYCVEQLRVLTPTKSSVENTMTQCTRALIKRVRKELPEQLTIDMQ